MQLLSTHIFKVWHWQSNVLSFDTTVGFNHDLSWQNRLTRPYLFPRVIDLRAIPSLLYSVIEYPSLRHGSVTTRSRPCQLVSINHVTVYAVSGASLWPQNCLCQASRRQFVYHEMSINMTTDHPQNISSISRPSSRPSTGHQHPPYLTSHKRPSSMFEDRDNLK